MIRSSNCRILGGPQLNKRDTLRSRLEQQKSVWRERLLHCRLPRPRHRNQPPYYVGARPLRLKLANPLGKSRARMRRAKLAMRRYVECVHAVVQDPRRGAPRTSGTRELRSHRYYQPATTRVLGATSVSFSYSTSTRGPPAHAPRLRKVRAEYEGEYVRFGFGLRELNSAFRFPSVDFDLGAGFDPVPASASLSSPDSSL